METNKAIYWDSKTNEGEIVSTGTYFYQLQVDEYAETKKMVIRKEDSIGHY